MTERPAADYHIMCGALLVGRIYETEDHSTGRTVWLWSVNSISTGGELGHLGGMAPSIGETRAFFRSAFDRW
jgi:hypothetical protein